MLGEFVNLTVTPVLIFVRMSPPIFSEALIHEPHPILRIMTEVIIEISLFDLLEGDIDHSFMVINKVLDT